MLADLERSVFFEKSGCLGRSGLDMAAGEKNEQIRSNLQTWLPHSREVRFNFRDDPPDENTTLETWPSLGKKRLDHQHTPAHVRAAPVTHVAAAPRPRRRRRPRGPEPQLLGVQRRQLAQLRIQMNNNE